MGSQLQVSEGPLVHMHSSSSRTSPAPGGPLHPTDAPPPGAPALPLGAQLHQCPQPQTGSLQPLSPGPQPWGPHMLLQLVPGRWRHCWHHQIPRSGEERSHCPEKWRGCAGTEDTKSILDFSTARHFLPLDTQKHAFPFQLSSSLQVSVTAKVTQLRTSRGLGSKATRVQPEDVSVSPVSWVVRAGQEAPYRPALSWDRGLGSKAGIVHWVLQHPGVPGGPVWVPQGVTPCQGANTMHRINPEVPPGSPWCQEYAEQFATRQLRWYFSAVKKPVKTGSWRSPWGVSSLSRGASSLKGLRAVAPRYPCAAFCLPAG